MTHVYGCHNRKPFATHQVAHGVDSQTGYIIRTEVLNRMAPDCQYTHTDLGKVDARCSGCKHKAQKEA